MVDETIETPAIDPAVEQKAIQRGWRPKEQWRGDPEMWQDAATYVKRSEEVLPYLRSVTQKQESEIEKLRRENSELAEKQRIAQEQIDAALDFQQSIQKRIVASDEAALAGELKAAREAGDTASEVRILRELAKTEVPVKPVVKPAPAQPAAVPFEQTPEGSAFIQANPWWTDDEDMKDVAVMIGGKLARKGELNGLTPAQRLDKIAAETLKYVGRPNSTAASKVEGTRSSSAGSGVDGNEHSFADLPQEARDACVKQAKSFVGKDPRFKDEASWRKHYVAAYFGDNWGRLRENA